VWCSSRSSSTPGHGAWSAGSSPATCAPRSSSTRCGWPCISAPGADIELVHHSDRGSQYTSIDYTQTLADHRVLASVGSVGDAYDNALAESFVDSFKTELISDRVWRTRSQLELAIVEYLGWFNGARIHQALGDLPPAEFEALSPPRFETSTSTMIKLETT
jgi:transposase InsO family protein